MLALAMVLWVEVVLVCLCAIVYILILLTRSKTNNKEEKQFDLYLAGPMRNYENKNKDMFLKVATLLREQGYSVFNPGQVNDDDMSFQECMRIDLDAVVNRCDGIAFLPDWKLSLGSNAEAFSAFVCGKPGFQTRLIKKETEVRLKKISLKNYCLPYRVKNKK